MGVQYEWSVDILISNEDIPEIYHHLKIFNDIGCAILQDRQLSQRYLGDLNLPKATQP